MIRTESYTYTFENVTEDGLSIKVNFVEDIPVVNKYTVTVNAGTYGTASPSSVTVDERTSFSMSLDEPKQSVTIVFGDGQNIIVTANSGYLVQAITSDGSTTITKNTILSVEYVQSKTISFTGQNDEQGSAIGYARASYNNVSKESSSYGKNRAISVTLALGTVITLEPVIHNSDYKFVHWVASSSDGSTEEIISGEAGTGRVVITLQSNTKNVWTAVFRKKKHTISVTNLAPDYGSIVPGEDVEVNDGANQSFTITPNAGYKIESIVVNGVPINLDDA